jgi:hypothetical protein
MTRPLSQPSEKPNVELRLANATKAVTTKRSVASLRQVNIDYKYRFYKELGIMLRQQIFLRYSADDLELRMKLFVGLRPLRESAATSMVMTMCQPLCDMVTVLD